MMTVTVWEQRGLLYSLPSQTLQCSSYLLLDSCRSITMRQMTQRAEIRKMLNTEKKSEGSQCPSCCSCGSSAAW
ncbi:hypothetical protein FGO68_gene428 [Halteria grandinella]|uniref:Uncharacterized protein n=1 Tax=Halteria grandinella TaxID=5974 RepID=A0A8J8NX41_HALGN|nr:hypothetical protein FGO68_gene428 [Halteria grandinella]